MGDMKEVLRADPFGVDVGVFRTEQAAVNYFRKAHGISFPRAGDAVAASAHAFIVNGTRWYALILPKRLPLSKVAHEVVHIADFIMNDCGVPCGVKNTEIRAYLVDHLLRQLWGE